MEGENGMKGRD